MLRRRRAPCAAAPDTGRFLWRMENESDESNPSGRCTPAGAMRRPPSDPWRRRACQGQPLSAKSTNLLPINPRTRFAAFLVYAQIPLLKSGRGAGRLYLSSPGRSSLLLARYRSHNSLPYLDETRRASTRRAYRSPPPPRPLLAPRTV
jgi:hypothetical protein